VELIHLIVLLVVIGVLLWLVNTQLGQFIQPPFLQIINVIVIIAVVLYLLAAFGLLPMLRMRLPPG
jgi:hypothetical protein